MLYPRSVVECVFELPMTFSFCSCESIAKDFNPRATTVFNDHSSPKFHAARIFETLTRFNI